MNQQDFSRAAAVAAGPGYEQIMRNVRGLVPDLRKRSAEIEENRSLPADVVASLRESGVFRMAMPAAWGGPELSSMEQIAVLEQLAQGDASAAWCAMIGMDSGLYAGYLAPEVAREVFPRLDMITAGWVPPIGRARLTEGGYRVEGLWRFGSGCTHADVILGGCLVYRGKLLMLDENQKPVTTMIMAPAGSFQIDRDSWRTTGLAGSGSCDYRAEDLFVPKEHTFSFTEPKRDSPLLRRPDAIMRKMPGVPLGVARAAIDYVRELADEQANPGWKRPRNLAAVLGEAEMKLAAARSLVYSSVEAQWKRILADEPIPAAERATVVLGRYHAFRTAREIALTLYDLLGGISVYRNATPLDRAVRDLTTACQHIVAQDKVLDWSGRVLLGEQPTDIALI